MTCTLLGWRQVCTPRGSVWLLAAVHVRPSSRLAMNAWLELSESGVQCSFQLLTGAAYGNLTTVRSLLPTASSASLYKVWLQLASPLWRPFLTAMTRYRRPCVGGSRWCGVCLCLLCSLATERAVPACGMYCTTV